MFVDNVQVLWASFCFRLLEVNAGFIDLFCKQKRCNTNTSKVHITTFYISVNSQLMSSLEQNGNIQQMFMQKHTLCFLIQHLVIPSLLFISQIHL